MAFKQERELQFDLYYKIHRDDPQAFSVYGYLLELSPGPIYLKFYMDVKSEHRSGNNAIIGFYVRGFMHQLHHSSFSAH